MTNVIDKSRALFLLEQCVDERGADYVYEPPGYTDWSTRCFYTRNGEPSCGIGLALFKAGATIEELHRLDEAGIGVFPVTPGMHELLRWGLQSVEVTAAAAAVFSSFQRWQDRGSPWEVSLRYAQHTAKEWEGIR